MLWSITEDDETALDRYEGWPTLYRKETLPIRYRGKPTDAMIYIMTEGKHYGQPSQSYLNTIRDGYRAARFNMDILRAAVTESTRLSFKER